MVFGKVLSLHLLLLVVVVLLVLTLKCLEAAVVGRRCPPSAASSLAQVHHYCRVGGYGSWGKNYHCYGDDDCRGVIDESIQPPFCTTNISSCSDVHYYSVCQKDNVKVGQAEEAVDALVPTKNCMMMDSGPGRFYCWDKFADQWCQGWIIAGQEQEQEQQQQREEEEEEEEQNEWVEWVERWLDDSSPSVSSAPMAYWDTHSPSPAPGLSAEMASTGNDGEEPTAGDGEEVSFVAEMAGDGEEPTGDAFPSPSPSPIATGNDGEEPTAGDGEEVSPVAEMAGDGEDPTADASPSPAPGPFDGSEEPTVDIWDDDQGEDDDAGGDDDGSSSVNESLLNFNAKKNQSFKWPGIIVIVVVGGLGVVMYRRRRVRHERMRRAADAHGSGEFTDNARVAGVEMT